MPLNANATPSALTPPAILDKVERLPFIETVANHPHLKAGDRVLVAAFVQATAKTQRLAKGNNDIVEWEKAARIMMALARSLRLTPQSTVQSAGRSRRDARPNVVEQYLAERPDDDDAGRAARHQRDRVDIFGDVVRKDNAMDEMVERRPTPPWPAARPSPSSPPAAPTCASCDRRRSAGS